jgi:cell wall-associated NlpC family hydrolase
MKKYKEKSIRFCTVLLSLLLCITFMPAGAFADDAADAQGNDIAVEELSNDAAPGGEAAEGDVTEEADGETGCTHESLIKYAEVKATCSSVGTKAYYKCSDCEKRFLDALAEEEVTDDSQLEIPIDPDAHKFGAWVKTKEATPDEMGELIRTCEYCGATETDEFEYVDPIVEPEDLVKSMTINGVKVQFTKSKVYKTPESDKNMMPGRVWVRGNKSSMQVNWKNASGVQGVDGVIILRATGTSKTYKEVARLPFKTYKDGKLTEKKRSQYTDKTASKKNTSYTYRVLSYIELSDITYVSKFSSLDWAAGQTSTSKLKNFYTATMNKKSATLQSKETLALKVTVKSPNTKFKAKSRRWYSSNKSVATISKGKVTAKAPGTATIRCRLASGYEITSKITVVGAFKPGTPKLAVDYATKTSITLIWSKAKHATSYDIYKSNDGLHWDKVPKNTTKTTYTYKGLTTGHRYTFYVIARNDHKGLDADGKSKTYTALGKNSNVINQKAVVKRRPMTLTGFPTKKSKATGTTLTVSIKVDPPLGRRAQLQMKSGKKWVTKKNITLPKGSEKKTVNITFPNSWWNSTTYWRLVIPPTTTTEGVTTDTLKITSTRYYQNPSGYVQIKDKISKHGYNHYVSPVLVNGSSSRSDHIEALIKTANKYKGDKYVQGRSGAPGKGIDESGLVMQACYGAGVDLWPISPSTRPYNCVPRIMNSKLKKIAYPKPVGDNYPGVNRGDLIFFATSKNGTPTRVAIYTGWGKLLLADIDAGKVTTSTIKTLEEREKNKLYVVGVRRIFN